MRTLVIAKALVVNDAGELLVLRRSLTDDRRPGQWDVPGGRVEENEDILATVKRETKEEAGIVLDGCRLVYAFSEVIDDGSGTWLAFLAPVVGRPKVTLSFEHSEYEWIPIEKAVKEITYGRQARMVQYVLDNNLLEGPTTP